MHHIEDGTTPYQSIHLSLYPPLTVHVNVIVSHLVLLNLMLFFSSFSFFYFFPLLCVDVPTSASSFIFTFFILFYLPYVEFDGLENESFRVPSNAHVEVVLQNKQGYATSPKLGIWKRKVVLLLLHNVF